MLSSSQALKRQGYHQTLRAVFQARSQFRFASHSAKPDASIARIIAEKKLNTRTKNVPLHLLPTIEPSADSSSRNFLSAPLSSSFLSPLDGSSNGVKILASNDNNDNSPPSKNPDSPAKPKRERKKNDESNKPKEEETPAEEKTPAEETPESDAPAKSTRSSGSSKKKDSGKSNASKEAENASPAAPQPAQPAATTEIQRPRPINATDPTRTNTETLFSIASASEKKQVLILPINRRPLIPGFHKAVDVKDKNVIKALKKILKEDLDDKCIGVFLLKEEKGDTDVVNSLDEIYPVGVYARIGGSFPGKSPDGGETFILYPTHRIQIGDIVPNAPQEGQQAEQSTPSTGTVSELPTEAELESEAEVEVDSSEVTVGTESDVTSFEKSTLSEADLDREELYKIPASWSRGVTDLEDLPYDHHSEMISALTAEILRILKELSVLNRPLKDQVVNLVLAGNKFSSSNVYEEPHILADFAASVSAGRAKEIQDVLASLNIEERLQKALILIKRELINIQLQEKINADVDNKIQKRQREYFLMEQLKGIKRELGMDDGREKLIQTFRDRAADLAMPESVSKVFEDEINKLMTLEPVAAEYNVTRQYLDWITQLPWGKYSKDSYNIKNAMTILDEDHYGLKDVKDRILEFIAVGKLLGTVDGKIVCFVGPPGVGKTSVAKSISKALNRKFYRFSIGGVSDVSELKGHRRTYVGALPGRIVQALKKTQTQNPLILIDEIDKIGRAGYHGDPSAALLELLDPEQNSSFLDHYMDVPIDMSKTLFVCTANSLDTIPGPLLDRMEVIEISGYVAEEKIAIAEKYLAPSAKKLAGLEGANVTLTHEAIQGIISKYARESGVRNLKKQIEKIYRKAALNIIKDIGEDNFVEEEVEEATVKSVSTEATESPEAAETTTEAVSEEKPAESKDKETASEATAVDEEPQQVSQHKPLKVPDNISIEINSADLKDYIGPPVYIEDRMYEKTPIGVVMGLGVTSMGGSTLYVESVLEQPLTVDSHAGMSQTGQLGSTMKESSSIAYSFARMFVGKNFPENRFFERAKIHLHCPEGAIPKDGPSAGITMATSLLSLALNEPLEPTIAMTGELTLTGKVLRIGGLREKSVAAKRSGATTIFFPKDNLADWEAMPDNIKEGLEPVPVSWYGDVFERAFQKLDRHTANQLWKSHFEKIDLASRKEGSAASA